MTIVTLTLKFDNFGTYEQAAKRGFKSTGQMLGWGVKIAGLKPNERKDFAELLSPVKALEEQVNGEIGLNITPWELPEFKSSVTVTKRNIPMELVTKLLNLVGALGYNVVGHSSVVDQEYDTTCIWTLQSTKIECACANAVCKK